MTEKTSLRVIGAIFATGIMSFCGVIIETAMNITFPTLMKEFHVTTDVVQWMTTIYLLVVASMVPLSATLKRRFKMKQLFLFAMLFFILGVVIDGMAQHFWMLLLGRMIQGLGTGIALPLMFNIILEQVPLGKRGMMMGIGTLITGVAPAIGPTFGGLVVATLGWRYIFVFLLPLLIFALILGMFCVQQKQPTQKTWIDPLTVILVIITFCSLVYGISNLGSQSFISLSVLGMFLVGVIALALFVWRSARITSPILDLALLKNAHFTRHLIAFGLLQVSALGLSFILPNYIQLVNGKSALTAGLIVLPGAALGAVMGPMSGNLYDRVGAKLPLRLGSTLVFIGIIGMCIIGRSMSDTAILISYVFYMIGIGLQFGNLMTNGLKGLDAQQNSDGNALFNTIQQFAAALGTSIAAAIVATGQTHASHQENGTAVGSWYALILLAILIFIQFLIVGYSTQRKNINNTL